MAELPTLKNYLTPSQYAKKIDIHRVTVNRHINAGRIKVKLVGMHKDRYIHWPTYKAYVFDKDKTNTALKK